MTLEHVLHLGLFRFHFSILLRFVAQYKNILLAKQGNVVFTEALTTSSATLTNVCDYMILITNNYCGILHWYQHMKEVGKI